MVAAQSIGQGAAMGAISEVTRRLLDAFDPIVAPVIKALRNASSWLANRLKRKNHVRPKPTLVTVREVDRILQRLQGAPLLDYLIIPDSYNDSLHGAANEAAKRRTFAPLEPIDSTQAVDDYSSSGDPSLDVG